MGFLDKFKRKDGFDDLLKEPEGDLFGSGENKPGDLALAGDTSSQPEGDLALGSNPAGDIGGNPFGGTAPQNDVMGLPPQSADSDMGGLDQFSSSSTNDSLSSNSTSASALGLDTNYPQTPQQQPEQQQQIQQNNPSQQYSQTDNVSKSEHEMELILTKLDLLKSTLQNFDSRLAHIEQKLYEKEDSRRRW